MNVLSIFGIIVMVVGSLVSILFWIPKLVDKKKLKEILGAKYLLVYVIYLANGPMLILLGVILIYLSGASS